MSAKDAAERAHEIVRSQGGVHSGSAWDASQHPRVPAGNTDGGEFAKLMVAAVTSVLKKAGHSSYLRHPEMGKDFNRAGYNAKRHNASTVAVHTHLDKGDTAAYVAKSKEYETALTKAGFHVSRRADASPEMLFVRKRK